MKRYRIIIDLEAPGEIETAFDLLAKMPVFEEMSKLARRAGFRVTGYTAERVKQ